MGSFNTACALSRISMGGGPAVFIPLVRGPFVKGEPIDLNGDTSIVSNEGPYTFFVALCPPLFGQMTDYGRLDDVENTPTARAVARAFGKSPQAFVDACGKSQKASGLVFRARSSEGYVSVEEKVGGCFVHRRVWDEMSTRFLDEWGHDGRSLWLSNAALFPRVLTMMGFKSEGTDAKRERFNVRWVHPLFPRLTLWSDGRWCRLEWPGMRASEGNHFSPRDIARAAVAHGGGPSRFPWQTVKLLRETPTYAIEHDEHLEKITRFRDMFARFRSTKKDQSDGYLAQSEGTMFSYGLDPGFLDRFWPEVSTGGLRDEIVAWWTFVSNMAACNQVLMPSYNGYQCGSHYAHRELSRLTTMILDEKINDAERSRREIDRAVRARRR